MSMEDAPRDIKISMAENGLLIEDLADLTCRRRWVARDTFQLAALMFELYGPANTRVETILRDYAIKKRKNDG